MNNFLANELLVDTVLLAVFTLVAFTVGMICQIKYKIQVPWNLILVLIGFLGVCLLIGNASH